eukprot:1136866-Pelagomonas_calceolata.AAC.4
MHAGGTLSPLAFKFEARSDWASTMRGGHSCTRLQLLKAVLTVTLITQHPHVQASVERLELRERAEQQAKISAHVHARRSSDWQEGHLTSTKPLSFSSELGGFVWMAYFFSHGLFISNCKEISMSQSEGSVVE